MILREKVNDGERGDCAICEKFDYETTGSLFQWDCPLLNRKICETHCAEVQVVDYRDTRKVVAEIIEWQSQLDDMLSICATCPFGDS